MADSSVFVLTFLGFSTKHPASRRPFSHNKNERFGDPPGCIGVGDVNARDAFQSDVKNECFCSAFSQDACGYSPLAAEGGRGVSGVAPSATAPASGTSGCC